MLKPPFARLLAVVLAAVLAGCEQPQQAAPPSDPVVTVAPPTRKIVVDQDEYVGRFVAVELGRDPRAASPAISTRCISPTDRWSSRAISCSPSTAGRSRSRSTSAKATLGQARANLAFTEADLARAAQLVRNKTITEQAFDQRTQAKRVAEAVVAAQEATVRQATSTSTSPSCVRRSTAASATGRVASAIW